MANGSRKGATIPRAVVVAKHGKSAPRRATKGDNGNAAYMARRRAEAAKRRFMCALLIRWPRGFSMEDAPPDRNEWTPGRRLW